jgi:hypothetical protein
MMPVRGRLFQLLVPSEQLASIGTARGLPIKLCEKLYCSVSMKLLLGVGYVRSEAFSLLVPSITQRLNLRVI